MDARYYITLERFMKAGDQAIVYTTKDQAFVAAVEFYGNFFYDPRDIGWTKGGRPFIFPYRIKFKILKESIKPPTISFSLDEDENGKALHINPNFIDELAFILDKGRTWNQYLQVSAIPISQEDFLTVLGRL